MASKPIKEKKTTGKANPDSEKEAAKKASPKPTKKEDEDDDDDFEDENVNPKLKGLDKKLVSFIQGEVLRARNPRS